ncbi:MAG TPA: glycosyltransferase [Bryobacteraceae bacterium]|jgi:spore maturation protein CgeB|nr:glycosyltransferase [Bryobacteraceae bacterium]
MKPGYRIAFFGSSLVSAYWNGAATYYRGLIRALHERGAEICFYEPDAYERQQHRDIADPDWARVRVYPAKEDQALKMVEEARDADLVVKASGIGVFDELLERAVLDARKPGSVVAFWDVDAPATLERIEANPSDPFRALISNYDLIFTYGGGDPVVRGYQRAGARLCVPIYNALDESTHYPVAPDLRFEAALAFLGNRLPDREARVCEFFFCAAELCPNERFIIGGNGWDTRAMSPNVRWAGHVYTKDHNAFNSTPRMVLNICRDSMVRFGFSPPTRLFEAAGAAACLITDAWEGIELFLEPGKEVLVAHDSKQVAEFLRYVTLEQAQCIGQAARTRILSEHTYAHRAAKVERVLEGKSYHHRGAI